ncbi:MAG TPA: sodium/proline symporter [Vicinamibacterales bacterium]|nr:sodium/proline symporter [Vicinamibacterales bacterium]
MTHEQTVLATLVAYKLALVLIGVFAGRRTHDGLDFFLAGRQLGPTVAALSSAASSSSAWTLLGVSGAAYAWGLGALWIFPACVGGFALNWFVLAPGLRRLSHETGAVTVTELLAGPADRPGRRAVVLVASGIILLSLGVYVASQFQGAGKTFGETFGLSMTASILIGAAVVVFYTMLGGFWAVSLTDTLQGLVMAVTAVVLPVVALGAVGGFGPLVEGLRAVPGGDYLSLTRGLPWTMGIGFIIGILGISLGYPGQPHVVNRYMAMRLGTTELRRARAIGLGWAAVVYAGMLLLGLSGRVLYPDLADPEVVMVVAANALLPAVLAGVMIAAVLSAIMSTADSQLLVAASAITHDLGMGASGRWSLLARSRVVVLLLAAGAVGAALYGSQEIFSRVLFAWAAMGAAFGPLLLVTVWRGPVPARATVLAMTAGFVLSVAAYSLPADPWKGVWERVLPFVAAFLLASLVAGLSRGRAAGRTG